MDDQFLPSKALAKAVDAFSQLPGVGKKTALRYVLHMLKQDTSKMIEFGQAFIDLAHNVHRCAVCGNISDQNICHICLDQNRNKHIICVVESLRDIMAVENTGQFDGTYHVLDGLISPMDGVSPSDLNIESLLKRVELEGIGEVVLALSATMEGDTTNFYLYRKLEPLGIDLTTLARGVAIGDELEYADEITLGRSIVNRTPYDSGNTSNV